MESGKDGDRATGDCSNSEEMTRSWNTVEAVVEGGAGERWWCSGHSLRGEPIRFAVNLIWSIGEEQSRMIQAFGKMELFFNETRKEHGRSRFKGKD